MLTAGPTPRINLANWEFRLEGLVENPVQWSWNEFNALPQQNFNLDIHCVTKWSKFDTKWRGVSPGTLLEHVQLRPEAAFVLAFSHGTYTRRLGQLPAAQRRIDAATLAAATGLVESVAARLQAQGLGCQMTPFARSGLGQRGAEAVGAGPGPAPVIRGPLARNR